MVNVKQIQWMQNGANKLRLKGSKLQLVPTKEDGKIVSLRIDDKYSINLGKTINYKEKFPYKVNIIEEVADGYELVVADRTKASLFMMPMFGGDHDLYLYDSLFVNAFIGVAGQENCLALLYRFSGQSVFLKFEQALRKFPSFRTIIDPSSYYVLFVFDIPPKFQDDYNKFILGKYSHFSPELKDRIFKFHKVDLDSSIGHILYKSEKRRLRLQESLDVKISKNAELFDIPDLEYEVFNKEYYI